MINTQTDRHTHTDGGNYNIRQPKLASGKNIAQNIYHVDKTKYFPRKKTLLQSGFLPRDLVIEAYMLNNSQEKMTSFLLSQGLV